MKLHNPKLLSLAQAVRLRSRIRRRGLKLVLTNGAFDLLHTGHLHFLERAGKLGELVVALNSDRSVRALKGRSRPILGERERAYALAQLPAVKGIVIFRRERLTREIRALKPDIYVKAGDYSLGSLDPGERGELERAGARIRFLPFLPGFSTTRMIARIRASATP
ncbi:MAG: adenylyltransferase/cytidyltransferase family protein [Opitutaceae bacterium]|jgi:rfaE bifunctional protein nucleotidyltransferase chain/domain